MTLEDKQLLLVDLCARLPYKPKALVNGHLSTILGIDENVVIICIDGNDYKDEIVISADDNSDDIKLYLRPMSSMTKEEEKEYDKTCNAVYKRAEPGLTYKGYWEHYPCAKSYNLLNAYHFDYRGLIKKDLAIAVTKENNPYN